ncbi:hypothetical protein HPP92_027430 [Vanilla planifolia]|uniref:Uncharacterized protein n=1 Tax=Vanilla planifolia TaxID=51239 RepID=A0A835U7N8_VANPL|nr:hypothetical protein HPP92_027430 [Vanilla planifolia]
MDAGMEGRRRRLPGEERKKTRWPFLARRLESSKNGRRWPMASHGSITMWSCFPESSAMKAK